MTINIKIITDNPDLYDYLDSRLENVEKFDFGETTESSNSIQRKLPFKTVIKITPDLTNIVKRKFSGVLISSLRSHRGDHKLKINGQQISTDDLGAVELMLDAIDS